MYRVEPQLIRRVLCGHYKLLPSQLDTMTLYDIYIMLDAYYYNKIEEQDLDYRKVAWQTSILVNTNGNVKRKVKPSQLYKGVDVYGSYSKYGKVQDVKSYVEKEKSKLKEIFNLK